ncbi:glutamate transport system permease protein [Microbacterium sp. SLBN-154]|uniref:amino acid ABC transporter permease n=1 Tax=Microbacterium sp. SLBN-154 TaxID=2768458 RepID=UPI001154427C|nr:amino acid ABC transporter permease [Microbacterium sp. SLBN-154]TQK19254.1 glutamate transport system permease protein [Microbacterium sp. SLBN-154]
MGVVTDNLDLWGETLLGTLILFFGGGLVALILGTIVAAMRVSPIPIARGVGSLYVNTIRNTPLTLVFFAFAFALPPLLGLRLTAQVSLTLAISALGIYTATYVAETIRSGINTVPVGQAEAARALGLTFGQVMSLVVLPQAFRSVIPPMMSVFIALLKNTTVAAGFSVVNLGSIRSYLSERGENQFVVILWVMVIFVALVLLLSWGQRSLENRWKVAR